MASQMTSAGTDNGKAAATAAMRVNAPIVPPALDTKMSAAGKSSKMKIVVIIFSLLLLLSSITGVGWWLLRSTAVSEPPEAEDSSNSTDEGDSATKPPASTPPAKQKSKVPSEEALLSLEPFTVNLADKDQARYMRLTVKLGLNSLKDAEKVRQDEVTATKIRDAILSMITSLTSDQVLSAEGKQQLRKDMVDKVNSVLTFGKVMNAYFLELVVQ